VSRVGGLPPIVRHVERMERLLPRGRPFSCAGGVAVYCCGMATYLCKTEPGDYSFDDLERDGKTVWDGVANPTANIHIRGVKRGDEILIYHTGSEKAVVGLARAVSDAYPDPERPEETAKGEVKYPVFDIEPVKRAGAAVTLKQIKSDGRFDDFPLVTMGRLSVMPVPKKLDAALRKMAKL